MPQPSLTRSFDNTNRLILQELNYDKPLLSNESAELIVALNNEQCEIYDKIMSLVKDEMCDFFLCMVIVVPAKLTCGRL